MVHQLGGYFEDTKKLTIVVHFLKRILGGLKDLKILFQVINLIHELLITLCIL